MAIESDDDMPELATNEEWRGIMRRARKDHGLSQDELGNRVGTSQVMISKIESGESGSSTFIKRICAELAIPLPQHYADEQDRAWSQLGHVLRQRDPEQYEHILRLVEMTAARLRSNLLHESDATHSDDKPPRKA